MSRIEMVDPDKISGDIEKMFEAVTAMMGRVPNSYRVLGSRSDGVKASPPFQRCNAARGSRQPTYLQTERNGSDQN